MKKTLFFIAITLISLNAFAQKTDSTALILIDIQYFYFTGGAVELVEPEQAAQQAKQLLSYFRENNALVVHVRHDFQPGGNIHELVKPCDGEKVITKKDVNSFLGTDLNNYLKNNNIKYVVLAGMQTHMCLEAGTRAAHDLGYNCTVIADACATRDLKYEDRIVPAADVHTSTLATLQSYARVIPLERYFKH
ncbi:cysteine hydrolase family protein [uncultured Draconibacterium sp.]|uniref:cysteine hydrolase family protein n=1 Tax=uncultured Draconibacterium sp. TaxID=1573823 RepID=UPI003216E08D